MGMQQNVLDGSSSGSGGLEEFNDGKRDFLGMLNNSEFSDITLIVDGNPIYCH